MKARYLDNGFRLYTDASDFSMFWLGKGTSLKNVQAVEDSLVGWVGTKWKTMVPGMQITATSTPARPHIVTLFGPRTSTPLSIIESRVAVNGAIMLIFLEAFPSGELTFQMMLSASRTASNHSLMITAWFGTQVLAGA